MKIRFLLLVLAMTVVTPGLAAQGQFSGRITIAVKDSLSGADLIAFYRRVPSGPHKNLLVFRSGDFTAELLGRALMSIQTDIQRNPHPSRKIESRFFRGLSTPGLEPAWEKDVHSLYERIRAQELREVKGIGRGRVVELTQSPKAPPCNGCPPDVRRPQG